MTPIYLNKNIVFLACLFIALQGFSQSYQQPNEQVIFSFRTAEKKMMYLCRDTTDMYLVYRFGTKDSVQFQFPQTLNKTSWGKFKHYFYLRGGGKANDGMDIDHLSFVNGGFKYSIYNEYTARDEKYICGVRVMNLDTQKEVDVHGVFKTRKGSLSYFRDNTLVEKDEEN